MSEYLQNLKEAVVAMHGCGCAFLHTSKVHEMMEGKTVWKGNVEVFDLSGHPQATKAYAWGYTDQQGEIQYIAILNTPPIDSPREAVQAAIASGVFN